MHITKRTRGYIRVHVRWQRGRADTYVHVWKADAHFVQMSHDVIEIDELEEHGGDGAGRLQTPRLVERVERAAAVQTQCVALQLRQVV